MQRASGQHDAIARFPRARSRAGCGRRSVATRHWSRAASRCSGGMEPAVRSPRIEPAIIRDGFEAALAFLSDLRRPCVASSGPHTHGTCGSDFRNNRTLVFESGTGHKRAGYPSDLLNRVNRCPEKCRPLLIGLGKVAQRSSRIINQQSSWEVCHVLTK